MSEAFDGTRKDPINREAAMMFAKGIKAPDRVTKEAHWDVCPPLMNKHQVAFHIGNDLTGKRFGRLLVVGRSKDMIAKRGRWIVRCDCGDFEARKNEAVNNPGNSTDCCVNCRPISKRKYKS